MTTGSVMFVLDDYERHDDGRVDLSHFALLIFPTPRQQSATPPRDAIILEAPQGAELQFDKNFRPERGEIGSIQRGEFPGKITIRSDMHEPGPDDDLVIETTDLADELEAALHAAMPFVSDWDRTSAAGASSRFGCSKRRLRNRRPDMKIVERRLIWRFSTTCGCACYLQREQPAARRQAENAAPSRLPLLRRSATRRSRRSK